MVIPPSKLSGLYVNGVANRSHPRAVTTPFSFGGSDYWVQTRRVLLG